MCLSWAPMFSFSSLNLSEGEVDAVGGHGLCLFHAALGGK